MTIQLQLKSRSHGLQWTTGHIYKFHYSAWANDPEPTIILMYKVTGTHPRTGRQHRYFQGVNLSYINRPDRKKFTQEWQRIFTANNGDVEFTWDLVQNKYPYLQNAVRRYFYTPNYYIQNAIHIPMDEMEQAVVGSWAKDFSKKVKVGLVKKFTSLMGFGNRRRI